MSGTTFSKLPVMIVALVIGLILTFTAVMPLVSSYSDDTVYKNEGFFYANYLKSDSTDILSWDHTKPTILTINGTDLDTSSWDSSYSNITVAFSEKWFVRFALDTNVIYLYVVDTTTSTSTGYASATNEKDFSVVCASGTATITIGEEVFTQTISGDGLIVSPTNSSPYVMKKSTTDAYVFGDSLVYGSGRTDRALGVQGTSVNAMFKASVDDGVQAIGYSPNTYTLGTTSVTYTEYSADPEIYKLSNFKFALTDGDNTGTLTYNQIFVPSQIVIPNDNPAVYKNLVSVLPLFALILLVAGAASLVYFKNKD